MRMDGYSRVSIAGELEEEPVERAATDYENPPPVTSAAVVSIDDRAVRQRTNSTASYYELRPSTVSTSHVDEEDAIDKAFRASAWFWFKLGAFILCMILSMMAVAGAVVLFAFVIASLADK
ncbi:hypothetical protein PYCC9005_005227 [Savitreella phatthalungensis]